MHPIPFVRQTECIPLKAFDPPSGIGAQAKLYDLNGADRRTDPQGPSQRSNAKMNARSLAELARLANKLALVADRSQHS